MHLKLGLVFCLFVLRLAGLNQLTTGEMVVTMPLSNVDVPIIDRNYSSGIFM